VIDRRARCAALAAGVLLGGAAAAQTVTQTVTLNGTIGSQHGVLVIDGQPHTVAVGATAKGVKLLSLTPTQAVVSVQGERRTLAVGAGPANAAAPAGDASRELVLTAGPGGHFRTLGQINGKAVADQIGLAYRNGPRSVVQTANGVVPVHSVTLDSVRIGGVVATYVDAVVIPAPMDYVLLGNSFLTRFQMKRENDVMRLEKR
jgi:aspartyl protease family protein